MIIKCRNGGEMGKRIFYTAPSTISFPIYFENNVLTRVGRSPPPNNVFKNTVVVICYVEYYITRTNLVAILLRR